MSDIIRNPSPERSSLRDQKQPRSDYDCSDRLHDALTPRRETFHGDRSRDDRHALALTALTHKQWLYWIAIVATVGGVLFGLAALLGWHLHPDNVARLLS